MILTPRQQVAIQREIENLNKEDTIQFLLWFFDELIKDQEIKDAKESEDYMEERMNEMKKERDNLKDERDNLIDEIYELKNPRK